MTPRTELPSTFAGRTQESIRRLARLARASPLDPVPGQVPGKPTDQLRLLTLNVAHGRRRGPHQVLQPELRLRRNVRQVAKALAEVNADVVALQEADGPSAWSGNFDHVATLAQSLEMPHHFRGDHNHLGVGRFHLKSGTALLSRYRLTEPKSHRFAQNWRDTKGFVLATVTIPQWESAEIDFVSVHLDFLAPRVRRRQVEQMAETLAARQRPLVLLGDFNCNWEVDPRTMELLTERLGLSTHEPEHHFPTYPAIRPFHRLDWILISEHLEFGPAHFTLPDPISDHLAVAADLKLR
ncbi:MAG TPA: endonuclease/exonuclease/phosphatase family protein [Thermoanaerobaculia bacterium]|nr:endonuclease/exonuclease/phosphatase family protein [Thermoanaerobaculia bacterium]